MFLCMVENVVSVSETHTKKPSLLELVQFGVGATVVTATMPYYIPTAISFTRRDRSTEPKVKFTPGEDACGYVGLFLGAGILGAQLVLMSDHPELAVIPYGTNLISACREAYLWCNKPTQ